MTNALQANHEASGLDRRSLLRGAAAIATTVVATSASARDFGRGAEPQRYPDPDIVVIDPKRFKAKVGNTAIKRLYTGCLWAEGPAWNAQGQYLVWSDIPANRQLRYLDDDGHISEQFHKPSNEAMATPSTSRAGKLPASGRGSCATSMTARSPCWLNKPTANS